MPPYGTDVSGPRVAVAPVAADGTFSVTATLPDAGWQSACSHATQFPEGKIAFGAYNADEPHTDARFATTHYTASIPPGWKPPPIVGPVTGTGPAPAHHEPWSLAALLAIAGSVVFGGGLVTRRKPEKR